MIINTKDVFVHELEKRIVEEIERLKLAAVHGAAADFAAYKYIAGQFTGLSNVLAVIEDLKSGNDGSDR